MLKIRYLEVKPVDVSLRRDCRRRFMVFYMICAARNCLNGSRGSIWRKIALAPVMSGMSMAVGSDVRVWR